MSLHRGWNHVGQIMAGMRMEPDLAVLFPDVATVGSLAAALEISAAEPGRVLRRWLPESDRLGHASVDTAPGRQALGLRTQRNVTADFRPKIEHRFRSGPGFDTFSNRKASVEPPARAGKPSSIRAHTDHSKRKSSTFDRNKTPSESDGVSAVHQPWHNPNRVCAVQGPVVTVAAARRRVV